MFLPGAASRATRRDCRASTLQHILVAALLLASGVDSQATISPQSGRIKGKIVAVTADKREPIPGVVISLTSVVLSTRELQVTSDEQGDYIFDGLVAGDYVVTVQLRGFEKYERKVMVPIEASVDLNILLVPLAVSETVDVMIEDRETRQTESNLPGQVTTQTLRNAPLAREKFQDALPLLPGVVRGPDGMLNIKGSRASQSGVLV